MGTLTDKRAKPKHVEVELGAFADIAFLLIIFFILTTSLVRPTGRVVEIPATSNPASAKSEEKFPTVTVLRNKIRYGENEDNMKDVSIEELRATLVGMRLEEKETKERIIVMDLAEEVEYGRAFEVISVIDFAGGVMALVEDDAEE